jgi:hypothetical protein
MRPTPGARLVVALHLGLRAAVPESPLDGRPGSEDETAVNAAAARGPAVAAETPPSRPGRTGDDRGCGRVRIYIRRAGGKRERKEPRGDGRGCGKNAQP